MDSTDSLHDLPGTFWGVCAYFNFTGYRSKIRNYKIFRESLRSQGLPLITVEAAMPGAPFELGPDDADILIQRRSSAMLWQKERLLNIGMDHLPADCDKVVWLDGDVVFAGPEWIEKTRALLTRFAVVQPFAEIQRLAQGHMPPSPLNPSPLAAETYLSAAWQTAMPQGEHRRILGAPGLALAARRSVIDGCRLYDRMILGGGDTVVLGSYMGLLLEHLDYIPYFPPRLLSDAKQWALQAWVAVSGNVSYTPGTAYHLWHGGRPQRYYVERQMLLNAFDPALDIRIDDEGCWAWASAKPDLHEAVRRYFLIRSEDDSLPDPEAQRIFDLSVQLAAANVREQQLHRDIASMRSRPLWKLCALLQSPISFLLPTGSRHRKAVASMLHRLLPNERTPENAA